MSEADKQRQHFQKMVSGEERARTVPILTEDRVSPKVNPIVIPSWNGWDPGPDYWMELEILWLQAKVSLTYRSPKSGMDIIVSYWLIDADGASKFHMNQAESASVLIFDLLRNEFEETPPLETSEFGWSAIEQCIRERDIQVEPPRGLRNDTGGWIARVDELYDLDPAPIGYGETPAFAAKDLQEKFPSILQEALRTGQIHVLPSLEDIHAELHAAGVDLTGGLPSEEFVRRLRDGEPIEVDAEELRKRWDLLWRSQRTARWHSLEIVGGQTVGDHTCGVHWIAREIAPANNARIELFHAIVNHDMAESLTGDCPRSVLYANKPEEIDEAERRVLSDHGLDVELTEEEQAVLKAADSLEGMLFCVAQRRLGNRNLDEAYRRYHETVEGLWEAVPGVQGFLRYVEDKWGEVA